MARKRPCRICRCWFLPHPRAGPRQQVCSRPECQRERHRRACADWRRRNPDYDAEDRVMCRNWREPCRRVSSGVAGHSEAGSRADFTLAMVGEHPLWASERPRATASARSGRSPVYEAQVTRRARRAEASTSGSLAVVEPKQPAEALSASDTAFPSAGLLVSDDELAAQALVMSLAMIMSDERG